MKKILSLLTLNLILCANSFALQPTSISAFAKTYADSPSYATNIYGEFIVDYYNESLPWGTEVTLHVGFSKAEFVDGKLIDQLDWTHKKSHVMHSVADYKWGSKFEQSLYSRGSSSQLTRINFVIEVKLPDGSVFFEKGSGTQGYFRALRPELGQCVSSASSYCSMEVESF
jgi:hypothetical protein